MLPFEKLGPFRSQHLHQEKDDVSDVAFDELVDKAGSLDLVKDRVDLVSLLADVLKDVVHFAAVKHLF